MDPAVPRWSSYLWFLLFQQVLKSSVWYTTASTAPTVGWADVHHFSEYVTELNSGHHCYTMYLKYDKPRWKTVGWRGYLLSLRRWRWMVSRKPWRHWTLEDNSPWLPLADLGKYFRCHKQWVWWSGDGLLTFAHSASSSSSGQTHE